MVTWSSMKLEMIACEVFAVLPVILRLSYEENLRGPGWVKLSAVGAFSFSFADSSLTLPLACELHFLSSHPWTMSPVPTSLCKNILVMPKCTHVSVPD